jgi:membrane protease YdiL (CAAX protease family)
MYNNFDPSPEKLTARDLRVLALWLLAGVIGAAVAFQFFFQAFPEASVDFRVTRTQAVSTARDFLAAQGFAMEGYESSVVFQLDDNAKTYLEREVGLAVANRLMAAEINVWWWDVRFFRPQQQEEFRVQVDPSGRVVGMRHVIEEARAGEKLDGEAARAAAEALLREWLRTNLTSFEYLPGEANSTERPNRRDWSFTWERRIPTLVELDKDAPYRMRITVQGGQADGYDEFLKVPEAWERDFRKLRSSNEFFQILAQVPFAFLLGAVFLKLYTLGRQGLVKWRGALLLGLVMTALFFLMNVNSWPLARHGYDTNSSYAGFLVQSLAFALLAGIGAALLVTLPVAGGEPLYRADYPGLLRLGAPFARRSWLAGLRSKEFFRATVIGLALAAAHIGFVVAFYLLGKQIGFWAPQDIRYTDAVSTALPWIYPLAISLYAATSEEFIFRLFAIPLLMRATKSKFIAIVLPAFVWGFLHSAYPQQPGWVRGVEVGLIGVGAGWVMLRWGILATLVWHYTVDALLIGLFLLRSENLYFQLSGWVVVALTLFPLIFATAAYALRGRFDAEPSLFNAAEPVVVPQEEPGEAPRKAGGPAEAAVETPYRAATAGGASVAPRAAAAYEPVNAHLLAVLLVIGVFGMGAAIRWQPERIGDYARFSLNAGEAKSRAREILRERGVDPDRFRSAASIAGTTSGVKNEFLRRAIGLAETNRLYRERVPSVFWRVRYFRDAEKEEYHVILHPDGGLHAVHHLLDEAAPGASLTKEEAQARAAAWLRDENKLDLALWKLVEAESTKQPKRTDHVLTWEELAPITPAREGGAGAGATEAAHVRVELKVQGDEVSGYRIFVKIPEQWERAQTEQTLERIAYLVLRIVFFLGLAITVLVVFFRNLKQQKIPWRRCAMWALGGAAAILVVYAASFEKVIAAVYTTEFPYQRFLAILAIGQFFGVMGVFSGLILLFGLGWFFLARRFGPEQLPAWRGMPPAYYRDALLLALGGTGALALLGQLDGLLDRLWPTAARELAAFAPEHLDLLFPAAGTLAGAVDSGLFTAGMVALGAGFIAWVGQSTATPQSNRLLQAGLLLLLALLLVGSWGSPADFAKNFLARLITLVAIWWGVARVFRFNLLAYFLLGVLGAVATGGRELIEQGDAFLRLQGYIVLAGGLVALAVPLAGWWKRSVAVPTSGPEH